MSAYAHQMEHEFSSGSLSSRGNSELGSRYVVETGFYMSTYAAAVFIGGIITVGVLLITFIIALSVMLQSCHSSTAGVVELAKPYQDDYSYCNIFALHAELNRFEADDIPVICRSLVVQYIKGGQYGRDVNLSIGLAESYFSSLTPHENGLDVVLVDIDGFFTSDTKCGGALIDRIDQCWFADWIQEAEKLRRMLTLRLCKKLQASRWPVILFTRRHEDERDGTAKLLVSAGYRGWSELIMRQDDEMQMDIQEYLSNRRTKMQRDGFRITGLISSQMDAVNGRSLGKRVFKVPNPTYYRLEHQTERRISSE